MGSPVPNEEMKMLSSGLKLRVVPFILCLLSAVSCAGGIGGIHLTRKADVPEDKIALLAGQIEEAVLNTDLKVPSASDYNASEQPGKDFEPMNLIISTDEIKQKAPELAELHADNEVMLSAIRGRIMRRPAVEEFKQKGCVGENREGYLQNVKDKACATDRRMKERVAYIILLENRDRRVIYEQVVKSAGLGKSNYSRVAEIFANEIYKKSNAGTPLQTREGKWERR